MKKPEQIIADLEAQVQNIQKKKDSIKEEVLKEMNLCNEGKMNIGVQRQNNTKRHLELEALCRGFEVSLRDAVDTLLGEDAQSNPALQKRVKKIKSQTVSEQDIYTYGSDRVQQLKDLHNAIHDVNINYG